MSFATQDNWQDFDGLDQISVEWSKCRENNFVYKATVKSSIWMLRMNDFPDEPLFTLFIDGKEILHFNDWPPAWTKPK